MERSLSSSPDPLNDSPTFQSPTRTRRSSIPRQSFLFQRSSPSKQTFELDLGNTLSPQKLKVTVEAGSDTENTYSQYGDEGEYGSPSRTVQPSSPRRARTTTTTVPLRGLSDSEVENHLTTPKRGRVRPRKSGTPIPPKHRRPSVTPTQKNRRRRKSIGELVYGDSENDEDFKPGRGIDSSRKPRRKSRTSGSLDNTGSSATKKITKGKRKTLTPEEIIVLADGDSAGAVVYDSDSGRRLEALSTINSNSAYSTARSTIEPDAEDEPDIALAIFHPGNETPRNVGWSSPRIVDSERALSPSRQTNSYPSPSSLEKAQGHNRSEVDDELDDAPEFDTILEGEDFSMISVESLPSLQQHFNSPPTQTLQRESSRSVEDQDFSIAHAIGADNYKSPASASRGNVEEVISQQKAKNRSLLSVQHTQMDDSFSSIPPEILEAATPARKSAIPTLLVNESLYAEDSFSSIAPEVLEAATPGRNLSKATAPNTASQQGEVYDDSFSAIPSAILDAATPAPLRQALFKPGKLTQAGIAPGRPSATASTQGVSSALSRTQSLDNARLLTPEETPSPSDDQNATSSSIPQNITSNGPALEHESYISAQMKSSPPVMAPPPQPYTAHLRPQPQFRPDETQTPSIIFSSPSLPPPIQAAKDNPFLGPKIDEDHEPSLSPVARAGRMLQDLVVPSSPRRRAEYLGSPFKSPVAERKSPSLSGGINPPSQERQREGSVRSDADRKSFSRGSQNSKFSTSIHDDDPFLNNVPSLSEKKSYSPEASERHQFSDPRLSNVISEGNSFQSDDAMSWQAEEVVSISQGTSPSANHNNSSARAGELLQSDAGRHSSTTGVSTWEERWAAERAAVSREAESADPSKVIVIDSEDGERATENDNDEEDFGLLLETLNSSSPTVQPRHQGPSSNNFKKSRRSLSPMKMKSKRPMYSDELSHLSSPMPARVSLTGNGANGGDALSTDFFASSRSRTFNFQPRVRERQRQDVFALLAASPNKLPPVLSRSLQQDNSPPAKSRSSHSLDLETASVTKDSDSQQYFRPIPQKLDFKPRVRDPESSFGSSPVRQPTYGIFGAQPGKERLSSAPVAPSSISSAPRPLRLSSPSEMSALPPLDRASSEQLSSPATTSTSAPSTELDEEEEEEVSLANDRTKEWTESVRLAAQMQPFSSPTKSCLRSPLKTPTGSRNGSWSSKTVAFVSSSPMPSSPPQQTLSSTTWSRDHWLFLDDIVHSWKPENQEEETRRRNSTRVLSKLLGKTVRSGEKTLKLEQWHLEAVDEFRESVPGWKEDTIAMRVFALIIGERDRAMGLVGKKRGQAEN